MKYQVNLARKFDTEKEMLEFIHDQIDIMAPKGEYMTFSRTGNAEDMASGDNWEVVAAIYKDGEIICPVSAGGDWKGFDKRDNVYV